MAKKETPFERIKRLIKNQNNIRNIATSAHIHHGKCIAGDSRLLLHNGDIKIAKKIYEEITDNGTIIQENEDYTIFSPNKKIEIFTLNKDSGKIEKKEIQYVWRLLGGKTIKIKLRNGFNIETTPEHKYIVYKDGFKEVCAEDLKLGDRVVCGRKLDVKPNKNIKSEILNKLSKENFYVNLKNDFHCFLKDKIHDFGIKNLKLSIKSKSFYHGIWQNRYNLNDLIVISNLFEISLEKIYDKIDYIYYRTGKQFGGNSLKIKLPQNFEDLFYLSGLFLGDGSGKKFVVGKEELGDKLIEICNKLEIKTKKVRRIDRTPEIHINLSLVYILKSLFDYPLKKKSHNIKISDFIFNSDNKLVASFLRGYFDTDGCVEKSRRAITISSASKQMIENLHLLLLRFGCIAIKEKRNALSISGLSAINYQKEIGFFHKEKAEKLRILIQKVSGSIVCDKINIKDQVMLVNKKLKDFDAQQLAFIEVKSIEQGFQDVVYDFTIPETHNFISEGMVIHNTALTDNLLAAAGMMSEKLAGSLEGGMMTWQHADEQERLLTVDAANVSMAHELEGQEYLINLIDTPGHVDFSGNVTRAMRAIDGTIVLVCAVEGIMPQTETVLKQALRERVKPILFINKVDRMIKELKLTPEKMQERFMKIIEHFNLLIEQIAEQDYRQKWKVNVADGSVIFGSARDNWATSVAFMKKKGIGFKDIIDLYNKLEDERKEWVWKNAPLFEVLLDSVIKHLPSPIEAQKYRIPKIWPGDTESEFGKGLVNCDPNAEPAFIITNTIIDQRSGKEISAGRLFSGTLKPGMDVYLNGDKKTQKIQQVLVYNGIKPEQMEEVTAGNVLAITGLVSRPSETITLKPEEPFENIKHIFDPVITKSISVNKPQDLPKLIDVLKKVAKEDPTLKIEINEETGENLMSGMGELHLEIIENRIKTEKGVDVKTSEPIVVYRETVLKEGETGEGKSPNKHNLFFIEVEPLEDEVYEAIKKREIHEGRTKKKNEELWRKLSELGVSNDEARQYRDIYKDCVFLDKTRGEVHIGEVIEMVMDGVEQVIDAGVLAREPCAKMKISLIDLKLHEDAIHRGPAQVYPAVRDSMRMSINSATPVLLEPIQTLLFEGPLANMGDMTKLIQSKRGQILDIQQGAGHVAIKSKLPVAEMIGLASEIRSTTEGRGTFSMVDQSFERVPPNIQPEVIREIRQRKGLAENE
ncbi:elongation factor EF-2 [Candidatus Pacearchaeota archaeon]|nr:elongation factor EF-2 [Candidatus Pacearchaeota archaeon]